MWARRTTLLIEKSKTSRRRGNNHSPSPVTFKKREPPPSGGLERKRKRTRQRRRKKKILNQRTAKKRHYYRQNRHNHVCKCIESMNFMSEPYSESNSEIVILAKHTTLTDDQIKILRKGLSFIPKPKRVDIRNLHRDIREFMTKTRMQFLMHQKNKTNKPQRDPFKLKNKNKPKFNEQLTVHRTLDTALWNIRQELLDQETKYIQTRPDNLTKKERIALKQLMDNPHLIINKADKGNTVVIEDRSDYITNAEKHLKDPTTYIPLNHDPTTTLKTNIQDKLKLMKQNRFLTEHWYQYCLPPESHRTSRLYFLKKIHKNPHGIRPIVSSCESITENISTFVDHWLQPYVKQLPSHIQDSSEFIKLIEKTKLPKECILASIDVSSLYTNIPHQDGLESIAFYLNNEKLTFNHPEQPEPEIIVELAKLVLKNNTFEFNEQIYLQKQGTAMGTKMAPSYANLFMGKLEEKLQDEHIHTWKRYIDDIFIIWTGTKEELESYISKINTLHPTIKFTYEMDTDELIFLDTTVYKGDRFKQHNILDIRTHIKKTNKQLYIHKDSYHPKSVKKAIIKGETKRYLRTNSNKTTFDHMKLKLIHKLKQRGYKTKEIIEETNKTTFDQRTESLHRKQKTTQRNIMFCTNYCDSIQWIKKVIRKHWKPVLQNQSLRSIFPTNPIIAQRTAPSLRNKLVRAKLRPLEKPPQETPSPNQTPYPNQTPSPNQDPNKINTSTQTNTEPKDKSYPYSLFKSSQQSFRNPTKPCEPNCHICKHLSTKTFAQSTLKGTKHPIHLPQETEHYNCKTNEVVYLNHMQPTWM